MFVAVLLVLSLSRSVFAQEDSDLSEQFRALNWQAGPTRGALGSVATIQVPEGFSFLGRGDAGKFMELNENPSDGAELGVLLNLESSWFIVFTFSSDGYVKDEERELDGDAILAAIKKGNEADNETRASRG